MTPGNHDIDAFSANGTLRMNTYFPPGRFAALGGVFQAGKIDNAYHLFTAGGTNWLVLTLEFGPRDTVLTWANSIAPKYPDRRIIVLTHTYLYSDDTLHGSNPNHVWLPPNNNGLAMWNKFVRLHSNISFVFNGHIVAGCPSACDPRVAANAAHGAGFLMSTGDGGNKVYQLFANYQEWSNKDTGLLRLLSFDPTAHTVRVQAYSPTKNYYLTDVENSFQLTNVELGPTLAASLRAPTASAGVDRKVRVADSVRFDASATMNPDGRAPTFNWDFGDGVTGAGMTPVHAYAGAGNYVARVTVNDGVFSVSAAINVVVMGGNTLFVEDFKNGDLALDCNRRGRLCAVEVRPVGPSSGG